MLTSSIFLIAAYPKPDFLARVSVLCVILVFVFSVILHIEINKVDLLSKQPMIGLILKQKQLVPVQDNLLGLNIFVYNI